MGVMIEDRLLLLRFKAGSGEAMRRIYGKYRGGLLKLAMGLCGDAGTAEDVVHDVFVKFAQSADRIGVQGNLRGYLGTCVANRVRTLMRRRRLEAAERPGVVAEPVCELSRPERWVIADEALTKLAAAMGQLPYEQREVVLLHIESGMTFRAISELQETSVNTVLSRYRYSIQKLRSLLNSEVEP